ncbi:MAG: hypothetical protein ACLTTU_08850 [Bilophila wadsworthia]
MATTPEKKKRATYTTPKGESLFAHLVNVDYGTEQYPDEKGSFNVTLALDADAAAKLDSPSPMRSTPPAPRPRRSSTA